ncbi:MAG: TIGR01777 family oxidoreductase [Chitinophagales bacterium]|nr:TIGR01777 family oxidoreductase [Chitinophagales bacterium]
MKTILITGASGLVGSALVPQLLERGYRVHTLGRSKPTKAGKDKLLKHFQWNVDAGTFDENALEGVDAIIHLAGAGVAEKKWSAERKKEIIDSRVRSAQLLFEYLKNNTHRIKTFISASAVGYYGDCGDKVIDETQPRGDGFLAEVCEKWENAAKQFSSLDIREVRCRIGIVLAENGGALPELTRSIPFGVAAYFNKADLYYPWIHIDDVCGIFIHALENETMHGAYNTTAPTPLLMKELMQEILRARKSSALLLPTPPLAIKIAMGEMSEMLLSSQRCSAKRISGSGYAFKCPMLKKALADIYKK